MKTLIIVEDGKVSVQVDDQAPVEVRSELPPPVAEMVEDRTSWPAATPDDVPMPASTVLVKPLIGTDDRREVYNYPKPTRFANKPCAVCGEPFAPKRGNQTLCGKPECKRERQRQYAAGYATDRKSDPDPPPFTLDEPEAPAEAPEPGVELRSRCCQAKVEPHTKPNGKTVYKCLGCGHQCGTHEYLPGHEKTPEEIESWKPKPTLPGADGYSSAPRDSVEENRQRKRK